MGRGVRAARTCQSQETEGAGRWRDDAGDFPSFSFFGTSRGLSDSQSFDVLCLARSNRLPVAANPRFLDTVGACEEMAQRLAKKAKAKAACFAEVSSKSLVKIWLAEP